MNVIDLFAGCGGLSLGFLQAGYSINKAVEFDSAIANTYKINHPEIDVLVDDIKNIDTAGVFKLGDAEVIIGGPPCQGFSMAGARIRQGFIDDPRNYLFKHYYNVVRTVKPKIFVMENVKGMQTMQKGKIFDEIISIFSDGELNEGAPYNIFHNISNTDINSSNVGGLYSYYKPAIQQARAILSLNFQSHNEKNGENEKGFVYTIPYTINMETLFEYYARTELKKALKGSEYRVEQYSKKLYLQKDIDNVDDAEKGIHLMSFCIPDIIIYKEDKPVVVIDAKYKLSGRPDRSDSHQLLSYVLLTGADRCGFVLPGEKTEVKEMVSTGDNYLPLAPRILRYYELLLGSKSDSSELQKVLQ